MKSPEWDSALEVVKALELGSALVMQSPELDSALEVVKVPESGSALVMKSRELDSASEVVQVLESGSVFHPQRSALTRHPQKTTDLSGYPKLSKPNRCRFPGMSTTRDYTRPHNCSQIPLHMQRPTLS
ncbi:unnamed protein product [Prorocentrum cordatum]|uniref:Uncharacterized protein n=1 Tax=Prorocentrum cordatum TaxID=2364126 RepID=A0ABN9Y440_9DINO|nr:unnamed protein product [Polarella glacialis]